MDESRIQCATCGRNGEPPAECETCHGTAQIEPRAYTLSEIRAGRAPDDGRYGPGGSVGPKTIKVPGSAGG